MEVVLSGVSLLFPLGCGVTCAPPIQRAMQAIGSLAAISVSALSAFFLATEVSVLHTVPPSVLVAVFGLCFSLGVLFAGIVAPSPPATRSYPATEGYQPSGERAKATPRKDYPMYDVHRHEESFLRVCDRLVDEAVDDLPKTHELPKPEVKWIKDMLTYNLRGGKMNRGMMVVLSGIELLKANNQAVTNDALNKLAVLGWCIEWLQAWLLIADDIMDSSETRRGQPCWYKHPHVNLIAINDAFMVDALMYRLLKRHFKDEPYYAQIVDLFQETSFQTECGQLIDLQCDNMDLNEFKLDRWLAIVKYKTAFYSFYLPVALGMTVAGVKESTSFNAAREPLVKMGIYFQAQDDYLDCFGHPETIGKIGTDIQDKKCGWLFVHAFNSLASPEQKLYLSKHYGRCKVGSTEELKIKDIYRELKLEDVYREYEQQSYNDIMEMRSAVEQAKLPWSVFEMFLKKVYKRCK